MSHTSIEPSERATPAEVAVSPSNEKSITKKTSQAHIVTFTDILADEISAKLEEKVPTSAKVLSAEEWLELQSEIKMLKIQIDSISRKLKKSQIDNTDLEQQIYAMRHSNENLYAEIVDLKREIYFIRCTLKNNRII